MKLLGERWLGPAAAVLAACLALGPVLSQLSTRMIGIGAVDDFGTLWMWEQARLALLGDPGRLMHNEALYFPYGMELFRNTGGNVLDGILAAPFSIFGATLGHNLALLSIVLANGAAAARLIPTPANQPEARWLVGISAALAPFPLYELAEGRPTQALLAPMIWSVHRLFLLRDGSGGRSVFVAGVAIATTGIFYWYYAIFLAAIGILLTAVWAARAPTRPAALRATATLALAALLVAPVVGPLVWSTFAGSAPGLRTGESPTYLLHSFQPLLGMVAAQQGRVLIGTQRAVPFALLLALGAVWRDRDRRAALSILAATGLILSVGPILFVNGRACLSPFWAVLHTLLPPLDRLWHPSRAIALVVVAGAYGLAAAPRPFRAALCAVGAFEAAWDGLLPLPTWSATPAAVDLCLAAGSDGGAVIDLPFASSQSVLWSQVVHRRPIAGGMHEGAPEFQPSLSVSLREANPFYRSLLEAARGLRTETPAPGTADELTKLGFRYVVLRLDAFPRNSGPARLVRDRAVEHLTDLLGTPLWKDARALLWSPQGAPLPCFGQEPTRDEQAAPPVRDRWIRELGRWEIKE